MLLGSPLSLPQLHFTVCPATSVLCVATIACAADSFVENLKQIKCYKYYRTIPRVKLFKWCDFVTEQDPIYFACCVFFHFSTILSSKGVNDVRKTCTIHRQAICLAKILKVSINEDIFRQAPNIRQEWRDHVRTSDTNKSNLLILFIIVSQFESTIKGFLKVKTQVFTFSEYCENYRESLLTPLLSRVRSFHDEI